MALSGFHLPLRVASRPLVVNFVERLLRGSALSHSGLTRPQVALTFDDGPHPAWTPRVLDALDQVGAKATFFVVGRNAAAHPQLVVETRRRGHEVGTHLFSHRRDTVTSDLSFEAEVVKSKALLEPLLGEPLKWLRFPYGERGKQRPRAVRAKFGLETVHWTFSSHDASTRQGADVVSRVSAGLRRGAIVLMHDALSDEAELRAPYVADRGATVAALPGIGALLAERGLSAVTLSELFRA
ncbi:MAG TPA: polysaccharide deacetylase family protein [Polyangiaceae bacterium]|nr:polysaccharide deacetylase family protein [Polyangiaceae bacterium]